jgi:endoglucanase
MGLGLGEQALALAPTVPPQDKLSDWTMFKSRFVVPDGRVIDTGNRNISHSEGQSYGMLLAEAAGDRDAFDRIWKWTNDTLGRRDIRLFAWQFDPMRGVADINNATDGDLMIAWALYKAGKRWHSNAYLQASQQVRDAIMKRLVVNFGGRTLLLPGMEGFTQPEAITVNVSYFVFPALDQFAKIDGRSGWQNLRDECLRLAREGLFGAPDLPVDWLVVDRAGRLWTAPDRPPNFGYDAIRIPLYLLWSNRKNDQALRGIRSFWATARLASGDLPATFNVKDGTKGSIAASVGLRRIVELTLNGRLENVVLADYGDYYSTVLWCLTGLAAR